MKSMKVKFHEVILSRSRFHEVEFNLNDKPLRTMKSYMKSFMKVL